jgi:hypothetical protein
MLTAAVATVTVSLLAGIGNIQISSGLLEEFVTAGVPL